MSNCKYCGKGPNTQKIPPMLCVTCAQLNLADTIPHLRGPARWTPENEGTFRCRACDNIHPGVDLNISGTSYGGHFCNARCAMRYATDAAEAGFEV